LTGFGDQMLVQEFDVFGKRVFFREGNDVDIFDE
jgi:hypothetical protein